MIWHSYHESDNTDLVCVEARTDRRAGFAGSGQAVRRGQPTGFNHSSQKESQESCRS
jgi:hypothetical protein